MVMIASLLHKVLSLDLQKDKTFTTILPETPTLVLRDPPGDGSYSFIEKNKKVCRKTSFSASLVGGEGLQTILDIGPDIDIGTVGPDIEFTSQISRDITAIHSIRVVNQNTMELCTSYDQRISTSEDDLIVGHEQGGDVFVGGALNIDIGYANAIGFDTLTCTASLDTFWPSPFLQGIMRTEFMYSEWAIKNTVLVYLQDALENAQTTLPIDTPAVNTFQTSINRWNTILNNNKDQIKNAKFIRNLSFDAGVTYEYAETSTIDTTSSIAVDTIDRFEDNSTIQVKFFGIGPGVVIKVNSEIIRGKKL